VRVASGCGTVVVVRLGSRVGFVAAAWVAGTGSSLLVVSADTVQSWPVMISLGKAVAGGSRMVVVDMAPLVSSQDTVAEVGSHMVAVAVAARMPSMLEVACSRM
jgi:hypothetical protein